MRNWLALAAIATTLSLAGCGPQREKEAQSDLQTFDVQEAASDRAGPATPPPAAPPPTASMRASTTESGPNVGPTAAPGVAFSYRYAFRLQASRVAQVQEEHARACEQLGVARCRITGMRYRVVNERDIEALLAFRLEPGIARRFGRMAADSVARADGMLVESEITGTDVGTTIRAAVRNVGEMQAELTRIEARLRGTGLSAGERAQLEYEAQQLRDAIRAQRETRREQEESLATTPMVFQYGSGELVPGFDNEPSIRRAAERARDNFLDGVAMVLIIAVTLLPWLIVALLGWWAFRAIRRRWFVKPAAETREISSATATEGPIPA